MKNEIFFDVRPDPKKYPFKKDGLFENLYVNLYYKDYFLGQGIFKYESLNSVKYIGFKISNISPYLSLSWSELSDMSINHLKKIGFWVYEGGMD